MFQAALTCVAAVYLSYLLENHPEGFEPKVITRDSDALLPSYDFIIVGAGSAGSVVANRLSERDDWNVLLLEAGGQEQELSRTPLMFSSLLNTRFDWNYTTTPQRQGCGSFGGRCPYPRGRSLGGSSAINGMMYARGYKLDYDRWGQHNPGWSFNDLQPYFLKLEGNTDSSLLNHGRDGPLTVSNPRHLSPFSEKIVQAAVTLGAKNVDCFDYEGDCIMFAQMTARDGRRCSASTAYLEPISTGRKNLHILTDALVTKLLIDGTTAKGVEYMRQGKTFTIHADQEVILSAGAFNSPKILMLSGIGPKDHLESLGIAVLADLPVGQNLQDHAYAQVTFEVKGNDTNTIDDVEPAIPVYVKNQTGLLSSNYGYSAMGFSTGGISKTPIFHYIISTFSESKKHVVNIMPTLMRPKSVGSVKLGNSDPLQDPIIDINIYGDEEDFIMTKKAAMDVVKLMQAPLLEAYEPKIQPTEQCSTSEPLENFLSCLVNNYAGLGHAVGTVKMSPKDKAGVVDHKLKVHCIDKLRVIDASIAPWVTSMNTNAMAIVIGEKGADLVKDDYK